MSQGTQPPFVVPLPIRPLTPARLVHQWKSLLGEKEAELAAAHEVIHDLRLDLEQQNDRSMALSEVGPVCEQSGKGKSHLLSRRSNHPFPPERTVSPAGVARHAGKAERGAADARRVQKRRPERRQPTPAPCRHVLRAPRKRGQALKTAQRPRDRVPSYPFPACLSLSLTFHLHSPKTSANASPTMRTTCKRCSGAFKTRARRRSGPRRPVQFAPPPASPATNPHRELAEARARIAKYEKDYGLEDAMGEMRVRRHARWAA